MLLAQWIRIRTSTSIDDPDQDPILVPTPDPIPIQVPVHTRQRPSRNWPLIGWVLPASDGVRLAICLPFGRQMATSW